MKFKCSICSRQIADNGMGFWTHLSSDGYYLKKQPHHYPEPVVFSKVFSQKKLKASQGEKVLVGSVSVPSTFRTATLKPRNPVAGYAGDKSPRKGDCESLKKSDIWLISPKEESAEQLLKRMEKKKVNRGSAERIGGAGQPIPPSSPTQKVSKEDTATHQKASRNPESFEECDSPNCWCHRKRKRKR